MKEPDLDEVTCPLWIHVNNYAGSHHNYVTHLHCIDATVDVVKASASRILIGRVDAASVALADLIGCQISFSVN